MTRPVNSATSAASTPPTAAAVARLVVDSPHAEGYLEQARDLTYWAQHAVMTVSYDAARDVLFVDVSDTFDADPSLLADSPEETQVSVADDLVYFYIEVAGFAVMTGCCLTNARQCLCADGGDMLRALVGGEVWRQAQQAVASSTTTRVSVPLLPTTTRELLIAWTIRAGQRPARWDDETSRTLVETLSDAQLGEIVAQWMAELSERGQAMPGVVRESDGAVRLAGQAADAADESPVSPLPIDDEAMPRLLSDCWTPDDGPLELEATAVSDGLAIRLPLPGTIRPGLKVYAAVELDGTTVSVELVGDPAPAGLPSILSGSQLVKPGSNARLIGIVVRRAEAA